MRAIALAALAALCATASAARADIGAPKHWTAFPGREVRAVSLRGTLFGSEPSFTIVQARDGNVYLRGRFGLYRFREDGREPQAVVDTTECSGWWESHGADTRTPVPLALCSRAQDIIVVGQRAHRHLRVPYPNPVQPLRKWDGRELTGVVADGDGGYWFAYGEADAIGHVRRDGRASLWPDLSLARDFSMSVSGGDAFATDAQCRLVRIRAGRLRTLDAADPACYGTGYWAAVVTTRDGSVWRLHLNRVERVTPAGVKTRWTLPMSAIGVAVTRDGTAFVLGGAAERPAARATVAVIRRRRAPVVYRVPMTSADGIAVDARDRIWITDFFDHAAALISPPGAPS
ncbi:MAG TPA: hypothetical protein VHT53_04035 [Candidatus Elarobacter sp.]|nr:hypothetical protein [Candidatus Elarobacter sp.]